MKSARLALIEVRLIPAEAAAHEMPHSTNVEAVDFPWEIRSADDLWPIARSLAHELCPARSEIPETEAPSSRTDGWRQRWSQAIARFAAASRIADRSLWHRDRV